MKQRELFRLTRNSAFLWKSAGALAGVLLVLGAAVSFLNVDRMDAYQEIVATPRFIDEFQDELEGIDGFSVAPELIGQAIAETLDRDAPFHEKLQYMGSLLHDFPPAGSLEVTVSEKLSEEQFVITEAFVLACADPENEQAMDPLERLAAGNPPPVDANYALALVRENRGERFAALEALVREEAEHDSAHARARLVRTYLELGKYDVLEAHVSDPKYREYYTPGLLLSIALDRMDWPMILKTHFAAAYEGIDPAMVVLALLSGLIWATIVIRFNGSFGRVWKFLIPALVLGALSAHATLLVIYWQEYQLGLVFGADTIQQIVYCLGIGLREEGLKLLLFVPLVPFLLRRDDLEIITVAGLVGLGFALEENINYFVYSAGLSAVARFATANFLHIALTAMCGLTFVRALVHRGEEIQHFAVTFILSVAIHGMYDAFLMVPLFMDYSWISFSIFVLMGYQYFGWLRHVRDEWRDPVSATAVFTYGVILVTGLTFGLYAWDAGPLPAVQAVVGEAISIAIILILFYREIPETVE